MEDLIEFGYQLPSVRQIAAGRAFLGWSQHTLAEQAGMSIASVRRLESGGVDIDTLQVKTIQKILEAFERQGVRFGRIREDEVVLFRSSTTPTCGGEGLEGGEGIPPPGGHPPKSV